MRMCKVIIVESRPKVRQADREEHHKRRPRSTCGYDTRRATSDVSDVSRLLNTKIKQQVYDDKTNSRIKERREKKDKKWMNWWSRQRK